MGTVRVVVLDVLGEHGLQMAAAEDDHPVETLAPDGTDHALTDGVGPGCPYGALYDPDAVGRKDGVEGSGEFGVAIADEELDGFALSARSIERLRACWVTQPVTGLAVTPAIRTRRVSW